MKRTFLAVLLASTAVPAYAAQIEVHPLDKGQLISIDGRISPNDFDVFKAKASPVSGRSVVFLNSSGGHLVAALQIGEFIRLKGWATIVPSECYSGCALIWLAGTERMMSANAKIGFHAASMNGQENGMGNALIGAYLNRLGLGYEAVAFATASSPDDMTYLTPSKAKQVGIEVSVIDPTPAQPPQIATAPPPAPAPKQQAIPICDKPIRQRSLDTICVEPKADPAPPPAPSDNSRQLSWNAYQVVANSFAAFNSPQATMSFRSGGSMFNVYWDAVSYYGKMTSKADVLIDKQKFFERWPIRDYKIRSDTVQVTCTEGQVDNAPGYTDCRVNGTVDWTATNQTARSIGSANFGYILRPYPSGSWRADSKQLPDLRISAENSTVTSRQVTPLAATTAPAQPVKSLSPDEVAMIAATVIVGGKECRIKGNDYPLNLAIAKLGQDAVDFKPDGRYAPLVEVKVKKGIEFVNGMGKAKGCEGIRQTLINFLPDIYAQKQGK